MAMILLLPAISIVVPRKRAAQDVPDSVRVAVRASLLRRDRGGVIRRPNG